MGTQAVTGPFITIERIWQIEDTIYVRADFNKAGPTYLPAVSAPAQSVKVNKSTMTNFGVITFIPLDKSENERARATYEVDK